MSRVKIERLLLVLMGLLCLIALAWPIIPHSESWDIHIHDTYIVLVSFQTIVAMLMYTCLLFGLYTFIRRKHGAVNPTVGVPHILITALFVLYCMFGHFLFDDDGNAGMPRRYIDYSEVGAIDSFRFSPPYDKIFDLLLLLFVVLQVIFWVYFSAVVFRQSRTGARM